MHDIVSGLSHLHKFNVVHGDLKAANILITSTHRACIADFGLSRVSDSQIPKVTSTTSAGRPNTIRWCAPEVALGSSSPNKECDIYSCGGVFYEASPVIIIAGFVPFYEMNQDAAILLAIINGQLPSRPTDTSDELWSLMSQCWEREPKSRPIAEALLQRLTGNRTIAPAEDWNDSSSIELQRNVTRSLLSAEALDFLTETLGADVIEREEWATNWGYVPVQTEDSTELNLTRSEERLENSEQGLRDTPRGSVAALMPDEGEELDSHESEVLTARIAALGIEEVEEGKEIQDREQDIDDTNISIATLQIELEERTHELAEQQQRVADLESQLSSRAKAEQKRNLALEASYNEAKAQVDKGYRRVQVKERELQSLQQILQAQLKALQEREAKLAERERQLHGSRAVSRGSGGQGRGRGQGRLTVLKVLPRNTDWLQLLFSNEKAYKRLLGQEGSIAQSLLDWLQQQIDAPGVSSNLRSSICKAIVYLSRKPGIYPRCLTIRNVTKVGKSPVTGDQIGDIWKGRIGEAADRFVFIKVIRNARNSLQVAIVFCEHLQHSSHQWQEYFREGIVWRQFRHPNLLPCLGLYFLDVAQQYAGLLYPWIENGGLVEFLHRSSVEHVQLMYDLASGLSHLHAMELIHGNLKDVNVLITQSGRACIASSQLFSTTAYLASGTARWSAPEIHQGDPRTKQSDIYSLGCIYYEGHHKIVAGGSIPFHELQRDPEIIAAVRQGKRPAKPPGIGDSLWALIEECWATELTSRPTAEVLVQRISAEKPGNIVPAGDWDTTLFTELQRNVAGTYQQSVALRFVEETVKGIARGN
ncbi:hypothetical protein VNI00_011100 [Paramarasmius palmivorus]|uniref:Protein kinase domain-containing protein n=1 Tax=Paramarasmius palmivorus TaxID=297713 RepID=A0AAW0CD26_9AGAR